MTHTLSRTPTLRSLAVTITLLALSAASPALAAEYVVGGVMYPTLASVPWSTLGAGDTVTIPYSATPYRETFAITTSGSAAMPIRVRGLAGPGGERPIIDGENAVAGANTHVRGLLSIRNGAANVVIEGLAFRHAHADYAHAGLFPGLNASGIYLEDGSHVIVRDCEFYRNGNGFFTAPGTADVRFERNYVYDNGNVNSTQEHNSYTESDGIVFEGNHYGPLLLGARGNSLKDRSAGTIIRYNFIDGGNRTLDLVEAETSDVDFTSRVASTPVYVYGNVLIKRDETTQSQVVHFGGDNGTTSNYRRTLYFYNNTVYSTRAVRTTFFHFDADAPVVDVRNSIFVTPTSTQIYLLDSSTSVGASVALVNDYLPTGWSVSVSAALSATVSNTAVTTGTMPGFVDAATLDFHLLPTATVRDGGAGLATGVLPVLLEYLVETETTPRVVDGPLDLGAFEVCEQGCPPAMPVDAGMTGGDAGGMGGDAGTGGDAGPGGTPATGGCGCTTAGNAGSSRSSAWAALALLLTMLARGRVLRARSMRP